MLAQLLVIAPVTVATAGISALLPARWGWMAFWLSVLAGTLVAALALAVALLVGIRSPFDWAGGFVVHLNVGLVVATLVAAGLGFFAVKTLRNTRRNGS